MSERLLHTYADAPTSSAQGPGMARRAPRGGAAGRRAFRLRLVTYLPSRPAKGDVLTMNVMRTVGSSTCTAKKAYYHYSLLPYRKITTISGIICNELSVHAVTACMWHCVELG